MERNLRRNEETDNEAIVASSEASRNNRWRRLFMRPEVVPLPALLSPETNDEEEEDDDEDEGATPASRRVRRILKHLGFFRTEKESAEKREGSFTPFVLAIDQPTVTPGRSVAETAPPSVDTTPVRINESPVIEHGAPESISQDYAEEVPLLVSEQTEATPVVPEARHNAGGEGRPPESPEVEDAPAASGEPGRRSPVEAIPTPVLAAASVEGAAATPAAPIRNERLTNPEPWGKLATAGVVVESLLRHRADREVRKDIKRGDESLQKQVDQQKFTSTRMERNLQDTRNRTNVVEQDMRQQQFEQRAAVVFERQQTQKPKGEIAHVPRAVTKLEPTRGLAPELAIPVMLKPETRNEVTVANEFIKMPDTQEFVEAHIEPAALMEQVAAAAEKNIPLERAYERRHEVKDDPGTQSSGGATSIGAILAGGGSSGINDFIPDSSGSNQQASLSVPNHKDDSVRISPVNYTTAALSGFAAALVIIVLGVMAYLTMR